MKKPEIDLLTIGDCSIDLFMKVDANFVSPEEGPEHQQICFFHGSKVPVEAFETSIAGNACNVAVACQKLGLKTAIYTELGKDQNGQRIIREMAAKEIDTSFCIENEGTPTNVHAIIVHAGERTIFSYHEPRNYKLYDWTTPKWIFYSSLAKGFEKFQKELVTYLAKNKQTGIAFNPGTQQLREGLKHLTNILKITDVLFVNKEEAELLIEKEEDNILKLHQNLQELGPKLTVITDGSNGSSALTGETLEKMGIYKTKEAILDKTGAGDAYASGFLAALFHNKPLREAMKWGTINAASVMTEIGAIRGLKTKEELEKTNDF